MGFALPADLSKSLEDSCPCRLVQLHQLTSLFSNLYPPPRTLVVHGLQGTGKLRTVSSVLSARRIKYAVVKSRECLSLRHLLSNIYNACLFATNPGEEDDAANARGSRCDSVNALSANLQELLHEREEKVVLVLDGIDKQRGLYPNILPALARLGDIIPNICLILVVTTSRTLFLQKTGVPYLYFPPYTRAEAISLVTRSPPALAPQQHLDKHRDLSSLQKWYSLFATIVYDTLFSPTSLSRTHFGSICETLWPRFIWPYLGGEQPPGKGRNAQWDFSKLLVRQRALFQSAGEEGLAARLLSNDQATTYVDLQAEQRKAEESVATRHATRHATPRTPSSPQVSKPQPSTSISTSTHALKLCPPSKTPLPPLLPLFLTLVLTAAYLASHTPPKLDILLFSHLSSSSRSARVKKSYHRRKLFHSTPSKQKPSSSIPGGGGGGGSTAKKPTKSGLDLNLNLPRGFTSERLAAILRAIHPTGVRRGSSVSDRVAEGLAELERLRLVVSVDGGGARGGLGGVWGGPEERKWRVNVPREFVQELGARYEREGVASLLRDFELVER